MTTTVDGFLESYISVIQENRGYPLGIRALRILFKYVKGDDQVFKRFIPSIKTVRSLGLDMVITSSNLKEQDLGLDFSAFILRYHRNVNYEYFTEDGSIISRIKRAETFRAWADIEDLAHVYEKLSASFSQH